MSLDFQDTLESLPVINQDHLYRIRHPLPQLLKNTKDWDERAEYADIMVSPTQVLFCLVTTSLSNMVTSENKTYTTEKQNVKPWDGRASEDQNRWYGSERGIQGSTWVQRKKVSRTVRVIRIF